VTLLPSSGSVILPALSAFAYVRDEHPAKSGEPRADPVTVLRDRVKAGDRVAAELLLAGLGEQASGTGFPENGKQHPVAWRAALVAYCGTGLDEVIELLGETRMAGQPISEDVQFSLLAAVWYRAWGDLPRSRELARHAGEVARDLDAAARAACHRVLAVQASHDGDDALADEHSRTALELAPGAHGTLLALTMSLYRARHALERERLAEAVAESEAAVRVGRVAGYPGFEPFALGIAAAAKAQLGRLGEALADAVGAARTPATGAARRDRAFGLTVLGGVHRRRREALQAREALEAALGEPLDCPAAPIVRTVALAELARVRAMDDLRSAREYARQAVESAAGPGRTAALLARSWVALLSGDTATAAADAEEVKAIASLDERPAATAEALELLGLLAPAPKAAADRFHEAGLRYRQVGDRLGEARVRMAAAALRGITGSRSVRWEQETLRHQGVRLDPGVADALTVVARRAPVIAVHALGGFQVLRGGVGVEPGEWQSKKARDLLKILVSHRGRPVPRARLMDLLWPGQSPSTGGNRLSVQLSTLRRVLDPDRRIQQGSPIIADRAAIAVNLDLVDVDVERFLITASDACTAHRHGHDDTAELLSAAESLYVGEFMPDEVYADWSQELRDEAEAAYISVLRAKAARSGDVDQRVSSLLRILRCDSYDEEAHIKLVQVLQEAGRHGEARRRYRAYVLCMQEIGVVPAMPQRPHKNRAR
jgi:DNA-binding SARP family transcriptional activator